ncbi:hypothetical protein AEP_00688 [Curvibacter sp. AEP1-3]|uniref:hypothetical protein n=1 Tax=Curvibacter sp. AEP1-3 TaxID=1844971 RepID=UPI000B3CFF26|nr:hypothetical protein [Curvibacter sp. AEP1-3]ARV17648.1 hypothetical protein AEP_00688 [Curvibacter sp. AEP1-3]
MNYRIRQSKKGPSAGTIIGIAFGSLLIIGAIVAGIYSVVFREKPADRLTLCPASGPLGHVIVLVDKSDPMGFTQRKDFEVLYRDIVTTLVPKHHLLSVYALADDFKATSEPLLELCNPGDGSDVSQLNGNPAMVKKAFDSKYLRPMVDLSDQLLTDKPGKASPILEMVQLVGITGFNKRAVAGEHRLIIISDMVQNSPQLNMYKGVPTYATFAGTPYGQKTLADLKGAKVEIRMLLNTPAVQGEGLLNFWRQYIKQSGGSVVAYEPIKG